MDEDFRSDRMGSPEGKGNAQSSWRRAWDAYSRTVNRTAAPVVQPLARAYGSRVATDLTGFWLVWHLHGGFEGLQQIGMSRSAIYRRVSAFRKYFGVHPDEYQMAGVTLDVAAYLAGTLPDTPESQIRD